MTAVTLVMLGYGDATIPIHRDRTLARLISYYGLSPGDLPAVAGTEPINLARTAAAWTGAAHAIAAYGYSLVRRGEEPGLTPPAQAFGRFWRDTDFSPVVPAAGKFDAMTAHHWRLDGRWGNGYDSTVFELEFEAAAALNRKGIPTDQAAKLATIAEARNYLQAADSGAAFEYLDTVFGNADG